jgi:fumarate hydratase class I
MRWFTSNLVGAMMRVLSVPLSDAVIRDLRVGETVALRGVVVTARDAAHRWLVETFIRKTRLPHEDDHAAIAALEPILKDGVIYHCGPVVAGLESKAYRVVAAGPTTSMRAEPYQAEVIQHFHVKGIIGKGGMGAKTLQACREAPAVYFHAIGGAATFIAQTVRRVLGVYKLEFGMPEALWVIEVHDLPLVVTMDAHGQSLHEEVARASGRVLTELLTDQIAHPAPS